MANSLSAKFVNDDIKNETNFLRFLLSSVFQRFWVSVLVALVALAGCSKSQPASEQPAAAQNGDDLHRSRHGWHDQWRREPERPAAEDEAAGYDGRSGLSDGAAAGRSCGGKGGKLANVFVYVKDGLPQGNFAVPTEPVVLDQKGCRYNPHILGIMAGQPLKITNTDTADHNIHDMPSNNPPFNESQMPTDKPVIKKFPNVEMMIPVQCNQHPWMRAYINVMSHPYFAVSGPDGSFEIKNLPPGEYTIAAVHERFGEQTMKVKVGPKENAKAAFVYYAAGQ